MAKTLPFDLLDTPRFRLGQLRERALAWGWPGWLGAIFLLSAAALALGWSPALRRQAAALDQSCADTDARAARLSKSRATGAPQLSPAERFLAGFGELSSRQERIGALLSLAASHQLEPQQSEFQQTREGPPGLVRFRIGMPVAGPYEAVRGFIDEALDRDPTLSLDSLRLRRGTAEAATVEADIRWSIYLRDDAKHAAESTAASAAK